MWGEKVLDDQHVRTCECGCVRLPIAALTNVLDVRVHAGFMNTDFGKVYAGHTPSFISCLDVACQRRLANTLLTNDVDYQR